MPDIIVRLRHPRGVSTLEFDPESTSIGELKVMIFSSTELAPSEQEVKFGYPPKPLPNDDEVFLSSIPITKGEQIVVTQAPVTSKPPIQSAVPDRSPLSQLPVTSTPSAAAASSVSAPPHSAPTKAETSSKPVTTDDAIHVDIPGSGGTILKHIIVPDDNSCLFNSLAVIFRGRMGGDICDELREIVAAKIRDDESGYPDVVLGMGREEYMKRMLDPDAWGGAIELAILAEHFQTEIASFDVLTGRVDRFGQDQYETRCFTVYSGIHYDAIVAAPMVDVPLEFCTTVFPVSDEQILASASQIVGMLKDRHYYTDTQNFDLRCQICKIGLKGEKGAREHAMQTRHVEFGEY